jgi:hypothetical protein
MVGRFAATLSLVVIGVIIADVLIHPAGTAAASTGVIGVEKPALNALLGTGS